MCLRVHLSPWRHADALVFDLQHHNIWLLRLSDSPPAEERPEPTICPDMTCERVPVLTPPLPLNVLAGFSNK